MVGGEPEDGGVGAVGQEAGEDWGLGVSGPPVRRGCGHAGETAKTGRHPPYTVLERGIGQVRLAKAYEVTVRVGARPLPDDRDDAVCRPSSAMRPKPDYLLIGMVALMTFGIANKIWPVIDYWHWPLVLPAAMATGCGLLLRRELRAREAEGQAGVEMRPKPDFLMIGIVAPATFAVMQSLSSRVAHPHWLLVLAVALFSGLGLSPWREMRARRVEGVVGGKTGPKSGFLLMGLVALITFSVANMMSPVMDPNWSMAMAVVLFAGSGVLGWRNLKRTRDLKRAEASPTAPTSRPPTRDAPRPRSRRGTGRSPASAPVCARAPRRR